MFRPKLALAVAAQAAGLSVIWITTACVAWLSSVWNMIIIGFIACFYL
jgi:hypothetical protein